MDWFRTWFLLPKHNGPPFEVGDVDGVEAVDSVADLVECGS